MAVAALQVKVEQVDRVADRQTRRVPAVGFRARATRAAQVQAQQVAVAVVVLVVQVLTPHQAQSVVLVVRHQRTTTQAQQSLIRAVAAEVGKRQAEAAEQTQATAAATPQATQARLIVVAVVAAVAMATLAATAAQGK